MLVSKITECLFDFVCEFGWLFALAAIAGIVIGELLG